MPYQEEYPPSKWLGASGQIRHDPIDLSNEDSRAQNKPDWVPAVSLA
jgi:hypothetical protein